MDCTLRAAAFLAQVRHETAGLQTLFQPLDNGAGALHMLPLNFREACKALPDLSQAFSDAFSGTQGCVTNDDPSAACDCGSDTDAGQIVQQPVHAVETAIWWMELGATQQMGSPCSDLREVSDEGLGNYAPPATRAMSGYYLVSHCIVGFLEDPGAAQRLSYYETAVQVLLGPTATITSSHSNALHMPTTATIIPFTATFPEDVTGFAAEDVVLSSGSVGSFTPLSAKTYTFTVSGMDEGELQVQVAGGSAVVASSGDPISTSLPFSINYASTFTYPPSVPASEWGLTMIDMLAMSATPCGDLCASLLALLNAVLQEYDMASPWDAAAFLALVRHDTAGFTAFANTRAGAIHMDSSTQRLACAALPMFEGMMAQQFPSCVGAGTAACDCGSDEELATVTRQPMIAMMTGGWMLAAGAEAINPGCGDLRPLLQQGIGHPAGNGLDATGYHRVVECIGDGPGSVDAGMAQRLAYYVHAVSTVLAPAIATITPAANPADSMPVGLTISFSQAVQGFSLAHLSTSSGTLQQLTALDQVGSAANTFTVQLDGAAIGDIDITVSAVPTNVQTFSSMAASITMSYVQDPITVQLTATLPDPVRSHTTPKFTIFFSEEPDADLQASGITVNGAQVTELEKVSAMHYTFKVSSFALLAGTVQVSVNTGAVTKAGGPSQQSNMITFNYDLHGCGQCDASSPCYFNTACYPSTNGLCPHGTTNCAQEPESPLVTVQLTTTVPSITSQNPIPLQVDLSAAVVEQLDASMFVISSGVLTEFVQLDATTVVLHLYNATGGEYLDIAFLPAVLTSVATGEGNVQPAPLRIFITPNGCSVCTVASGMPCSHEGACSSKVGGSCSPGTLDCGDNTKPVITLHGSSHMYAEAGEPWRDPWAQAWDDVRGNLTAAISVLGAVDVNAPGNHTLLYSVSDGRNTGTAVRVVTVRDTTPPVVTLRGEAALEVEARAAPAYTDEGADAVDSFEGTVAVSLTSSAVVTTQLGAQSVTWSSSDSSGNTATATRTVTIIDTTPPAITISDDSDVVLELGDAAYVEAATATAADIVDGAVAVSVVTNVNTGAVGEYASVWTASDASGNTATAQRKVEVLDTVPPVITLNGNASVTLAVGGQFIDPFVQADDSVLGNITALVTVTDNLDVNTVGTYTRTYTVTDGSHTVSVTRTFKVVASVVLTLNGDAAMNWEAATAFADPGATATSSLNGDVSGSIIVTGSVDVMALGAHIITYSITDAAGSTTSLTRTVTVVDTTPPVITLLGGTTLSIAVGETFTEPGATAADSLDADVSSTISVAGSVDTAVAGSYSLTYSATDGSGNTGTATRTVVVATSSFSGQEDGGAAVGPEALAGNLFGQCGMLCFVIAIIVIALLCCCCGFVAWKVRSNRNKAAGNKVTPAPVDKHAVRPKQLGQVKKGSLTTTQGGKAEAVRGAAAVGGAAGAAEVADFSSSDEEDAKSDEGSQRALLDSVQPTAAPKSSGVVRAPVAVHATSSSVSSSTMMTQSFRMKASTPKAAPEMTVAELEPVSEAEVKAEQEVEAEQEAEQADSSASEDEQERELPRHSSWKAPARSFGTSSSLLKAADERMALPLPAAAADAGDEEFKGSNLDVDDTWSDDELGGPTTPGGVSPAALPEPDAARRKQKLPRFPTEYRQKWEEPWFEEAKQ